ncbi:MAG: hypothetical protein ACYC57_02390 [Thermoleophilia bacterium]
MNERMKQIPIEGKVALVLNAREVSINVGENVGVIENMYFKILGDKPIEVQDPETGNVLGVIDREKVRVKVTEVHENFSVCRTYKTRKTGNFMLGTIFDALEPVREIPETLKAEDSAYPPPITEEESYVKRGDRVVQIVKEDNA